MRKLVLMSSVSLDGFIEGPNREIDWHRVDEELHSHFNQYLSTTSAFLGGRVTYELMAGFWPTADQDPESPPPMVEFAREDGCLGCAAGGCRRRRLRVERVLKRTTHPP